MAFASFKEYLDHKNKLKEKPEVEKVPDYHGPQDSKPAKEKKHKEAGGSGQVGETKGYTPSTSPVDPNKNKKDGKGFADEGDKALKSDDMGEVKDGASVNGIPGGKNLGGWAKTKTQEWVESTKGASMAEFTQKLKQEIASDCSENAYAKIRNVVELCKCNNKYIENLIREMKRNDLLPLLSEAIGPPIHADDEEMSDIDGEMDAPEDMGDEEGLDDMSDEDMGDENMGSALGEPEGDMSSDMPMPKPKRKKHPHASKALKAMQGPPAPMDAPMMMKKKMKKK